MDSNKKFEMFMVHLLVCICVSISFFNTSTGYNFQNNVFLGIGYRKKLIKI